MKFYVYLLKCKGDTYYVGKGQDKRIFDSVEERDALSCQLWFVNSENEALNLEDKIWRGMTKKGYKLLNEQRPKVCRMRLTYKGKTKTIKEWGRELGIRYPLIYRRLRDGCSVEVALSKPRPKSCTLTYNGETKTYDKWADCVGLSAAAIYQRLRSGWSVGQALTLPLGTHCDPTQLTYEGETKSIRRWAKQFKLDTGTVNSRLKRGWSVEETLTRRPHKYRRR